MLCADIRDLFVVTDTIADLRFKTVTYPGLLISVGRGCYHDSVMWTKIIAIEYDG
jgi:hypothetical protein